LIFPKHVSSQSFFLKLASVLIGTHNLNLLAAAHADHLHKGTYTASLSVPQLPSICRPNHSSLSAPRPVLSTSAVSIPISHSTQLHTYHLDLTDVGDFEYWKISEVLARVSDPEQLHQIEEASPQIKGEDAELWRLLIARDVPDWRRKNYAPKNPTKWYQVYKKYMREQKQEIEADKQKLKEAMLGLKKEKENNVSKVVDARHLPKLPRDPRMKANAGVLLGGRKKGFASTGSSVLAFTGGSKTKMTTGASVLMRARREAKEVSARNRLITPTHNLHGPTSQVRKAPQAMVDEYRRAAEPALKIYTPRKRPADFASGGVSNQHGTISKSSLEERERRLRALKMGSSEKADSGPKPTLVGDSDSDNDDDIFGEEPPMPVKRPQARPNFPSHRPAPTIRRVPITDHLSKSEVSPHNSPSTSGNRNTIGSGRPIPSPATHGGRRSRSPSPSQGQTSGHGSGMASGGPKIIKRRKQEADIFNRGASNKRARGF
jgi:elongin-A